MKSSYLRTGLVLLLLSLPGGAWAAITTSVIVEDMPQRDGRRHVRERHTDNTGAIHEVAYMAEAGANVATTMASRVAQLEAAAVEGELGKNEATVLGDGTPNPTFVFCTVAQFRARIRQRYQTLSGVQASRLGWYINSLALNDAQLTAIFGVSGAPLTALKTKLTNQSAKYTAIISEAGQ